MKIGKAKDIHERRPFMKVAIVGASGSGKTHWSSRSPRPLIIATEPQSLATAVEANPDAVVVQIETWREFREVWNAVKLAKPIEVETKTSEGGTEKQPACEATLSGETVVFQTVVVDSFTDLQRMALGKLAGVEDGGKDRLDFDAGKVSLTIEKWGMLTSACEAIWSQQRALPCNTIFLFVANDVADDQGVRTTLPMLSGSKLPFSMGQYFNAVGLQYVRPGGEGGLSYMTRFAVPTSKAIAKPAPGWPAHIIHDSTPGRTTLGSLLRYSYPGREVASEPHDSADFVSGPPSPKSDETEETEETEVRSSRRRRR
jgi:hypothetical protein